MGRGKIIPRRPLFQHMTRLLKCKEIAQPAWYETMKRFPPPPEPMKASTPPLITFEEDHLVERYQRSSGAAYLQGIRIADEKPHIARRFAWRQLELMKNGQSESEAFENTTMEFSQENAAQEGLDIKGILDRAQEEEEIHIQCALHEVRAKDARDRALARTRTFGMTHSEYAMSRDDAARF
mmetsp:Transcript_26932/g.32693  ORF Transcript_26932/g.32693 Transcript_26932/m.32693 type:complete len:181 (-) Transcript_26932:125-667(-)|eukprot:CAMPEP_0197848936 /NCGR_PEP_ID=MMETSP1438-20131217/10548_1 /TAXON_ID=1461541 /ORGANISM="Pterosperma sp., Strain CCMP1384" /LENGTH=180 /DNA_ID=CAMNT_0043461417 /DNA_START=297 /DNA_END=839 /DNA_ORIENTATION=+